MPHSVGVLTVQGPELAKRAKAHAPRVGKLVRGPGTTGKVRARQRESEIVLSHIQSVESLMKLRMIHQIFRTQKTGVSHHTQLRRNFILKIVEQTRGRDGLKKNNLLTKEMRVELPHPIFTLPHHILILMVAPRNLHEGDATASKDMLLSV